MAVGHVPLETLLVGWKQIGAYFQLTATAMRTRYGEDLLSSGFAFKMRRGCPPRIFVCSWPSLLQFWAITRAEKSGLLE